MCWRWLSRFLYGCYTNDVMDIASNKTWFQVLLALVWLKYLNLLNHIHIYIERNVVWEQRICIRNRKSKSRTHIPYIQKNFVIPTNLAEVANKFFKSGDSLTKFRHAKTDMILLNTPLLSLLNHIYN